MSNLVKVIKLKKNLSPSQKTTPQILDTEITETYSETEIPTKIQLKKTPNVSIKFELDDYDQVLLSEEDLGETIEITYKYDIDLLRIHELIRNHFLYDKQTIPEYETQIEKIDKDILFAMTLNEKRKLINRKSELQNKLKDIMNSESWNKYIDKVRDLLISYLEVSTEKSKGIVVIGKKSENKENKEKTKIRLDIIERYINIANNYITINVSRIEKSNVACPVCETLFEDFDIDEDLGICLCPSCGWFRENLAKTSYSKEHGKTSSSNRSDYDDRENFKAAIIRFACKQVKIFHENLEQDLDEYFTSIGIDKGQVIRNKPSINGRKAGVGFQKMIKALTALSKTSSKKGKYEYRKIYSEYYEDAWLIMHNYWGFSANDVMPLMTKLMQIYDATQEVYNSMTKEERCGRDAALNTQFRLYVELLACDFKCYKTDFKLQTSNESLENHQKSWKIMCIKSATKFVKII